MTDEHTPLREQVDRSGFAFNMAVSATIRNSASGQRWECIGTEVPWSASFPPRSGFIDVVVKRDCAVGVIECKKTNTDDRLVFLTERGQSPNVTRCRLEVYAQEAPEQDVGVMPTPNFLPRFAVYDCNMPAGSPESSYCVPPRDKKNLNLDSIASDLLASCEGFLGDWNLTLPAEFVGAIPIIVTNAQLFTCEFDPGTMDLGTGDIPDDAPVARRSFVRFRKALGASPGMNSPESMKLGEVAAEEERTVFVVDSRELVPFLAGLRSIWEENGAFELVSGH